MFLIVEQKQLQVEDAHDSERKRRIDTERFSLMTIILVLFSYPTACESLFLLKRQKQHIQLGLSLLPPDMSWKCTTVQKTNCCRKRDKPRLGWGRGH